MLDDLARKRVLVTGASTGIGAAAAAAFAKRGAVVALHFNQSRKGAEAVASSIREDGGTCHLVAGDLTNGARPSVSSRKPRRRSAGSTFSSTTPAR